MILLYIYLIGYLISLNVLFIILFDPNDGYPDTMLAWAMAMVISLLWPLIISAAPAYLFRRRLG